ncbi:MAG: sterol desaturase family protein, partial [Proteobacteria bacterium]|nr:sterol desaturase family protein [Pseudomonadota bacterium]
RDPLNLDILFIPLESFVLLPLIAGLCWLLMPTAAAAATLFCAYVAGVLHYEWAHFLVHTSYRPRSRYYRHLWQNHRLHHFKNERYWYGVSMTGGDWVLRTAPDRDQVASSPTCRTLGLEEDLGAGGARA